MEEKIFCAGPGNFLQSFSHQKFNLRHSRNLWGKKEDLSQIQKLNKKLKQTKLGQKLNINDKHVVHTKIKKSLFNRLLFHKYQTNKPQNSNKYSLTNTLYKIRLIKNN